MKQIRSAVIIALVFVLVLIANHPVLARNFRRAIGDGEPPAFDTGVLGTDGQPKICRDGMHFGLVAMTERFTQDGEDRPWSLDIDFTDTYGYSQAFSRTLTMRTLADSLEVEGETFGYMHYASFDWSGTPAPVGDEVDLFITNWLESVEVVDCRVLQTEFVQTMAGSDSADISDHLVFQLSAHDPDEGYADGNGIARVEMRIFDPEGRVVQERTESTPGYCAFDGDYPCQEWDFAQHDFKWPDGTAIHNGPHVLQAYVHAVDNPDDDIQEQIPGIEKTVTITLPIQAAFAQIAPGGLETTIDEALAFQVTAFDPDKGTADGSGIERVELRILDPDGTLVYEKTEAGAGWCAFGGNDPCTVWRFADHDFQWPGGAPVTDGAHSLRATAHAADGRTKTIETTATLQLERPDPHPYPLYLPAVVGG